MDRKNFPDRYSFLKGVFYCTTYLKVRGLVQVCYYHEAFPELPVLRRQGAEAAIPGHDLMRMQRYMKLS